MLNPNQKTGIKKEDLIPNILLLSANILFIILFLLLGYYNRFATDDFAYYFRVRDMGIWDAFVFAYKTWNTRWASILLMNMMMKIFSPESSLLEYYILLLGLFFVAVYRMMKALFAFLLFEINRVFIANISLLFISGFFLFTFGINDSWFWMNASTIYIFPVILFCLGVSFMLNDKDNFFTHLMLNICFLLAGGGNEPFAIIIIYLLFSVWIKQVVPSSFTVLRHHSKPHLYKINAAILITITSFFINAFCPGIAVRQGFLPPSNAGHIVASIGYSLFLLGKTVVLEKSWFIVPYLISWMLVGGYIAKGNRILNYSTKAITNGMVIWLLIIAMFTVSVSAIMLHGMPPMRTMTVISFFMAIGIAVVGFFIGYHYFNLKFFRIICNIGILALSLSLSITIVIQYPIVKARAGAYDQRIAVLKALETNHTTASQKVSQLPPSGWLYGGDISSDTANIQNRYLRDALGLHFAVSVEGKQE